MRLMPMLLLAALGGYVAIVPVSAQSPNQPRVGLLSLHRAEHEQATNTGASAFRKKMEALGYTEPRNLELHVRHADGDRGRLEALAAELVAKEVAVIVAVGTDATRAAQQATPTIPIVMAGVSDPLTSGFVASVPRPGGNITGLSMWSDEVAEKQLEILKEAVPRLQMVGALHVRTALHAARLERLKGAAQRLAIRLTPREVTTADDLPSVFQQMLDSGIEGLLILSSPTLDDMRERIATLSLGHGLPAAGHQSHFARAGILLSYGPDLRDLHARSAIYVDKLLKGARVADLPVEQAERFEFVINLKTAKTLGLTIPPTLLARADEVIE
jgi:putative ABC transport system substrate-binding protein